VYPTASWKVYVCVVLLRKVKIVYVVYTCRYIIVCVALRWLVCLHLFVLCMIYLMHNICDILNSLLRLHFCKWSFYSYLLNIAEPIHSISTFVLNLEFLSQEPSFRGLLYIIIACYILGSYSGVIKMLTYKYFKINNPGYNLVLRYSLLISNSK